MKQKRKENKNMIVFTFALGLIVTGSVIYQHISSPEEITVNDFSEVGINSTTEPFIPESDELEIAPWHGELNSNEEISPSIIEQEKSFLEEKRSQKVEGIDLNIVSIYNRVFGARDGLAVVNLSGNGCGGCGAQVPMQKVTEVRANTGIHHCDVCGRFLYSENNSVN